MSKWVKTIIAVLLLPLCFGAAKGLFLVLCASGSADTVWVPLAAGGACWLVVYLLLPKPILLYVFGHELTHALWTLAFGGRIRRFRATSQGGHVVITRNNFLITLAPYFFPFYAAVVVIVFLVGHCLWDWTRYLVWFHLLVGAAYAFHLTLTWNALQTRQSDITQQGYLFSAVVIWLGNLSVLILGVPLVTAQVRLLTALDWCVKSTGEVLGRLAACFR